MVRLAFDSGTGTYVAVLRHSPTEDEDEYIAAAEVQVSQTEAVLVDKWYREG